jgi:orotidine-5'-phosphate decarboxylase
MINPTWSELVQNNVERFGDLVVGIDPSLPEIPEFFGRESSWIADFVNFTLDVVEGQVGFVKFQSAYFEAGGLQGLSALSSGMKRARRAGIAVILDAKRGDIGATSAPMREPI